MPRTRPPPLVSFLVGPVRDGGWSEAHYNSFEAIRQRMNLVLYRESVNTQDGSVVRVIDELVRKRQR